MSSTVTQQRMEVEQLRREAAMKRIPVSQAVDDIKVFTERINYIIIKRLSLNIFHLVLVEKTSNSTETL